MKSPDLASPDSVAEACKLLGDHGGSAKVIAGGTAVVLMMRQGLISPDLLVSLHRIQGLSSIQITDDHVHFGGKVTLSEVAASELVRSRLPSFARACAVVGNARVRNAATIAGNLAEADYASDPPAALMSLSGTCVIQGPNGTRTTPVADLISGFFTTTLGRDEIITSVRVPIPDSEQRAVYMRFVSRSSEDRPCVGVAVRAGISDGTVEDLDIVIGAVSSTPVTVPDACGLAIGRGLEDGIIRSVADGYADAIDPIDDLCGSSWYRTQIIRVFVTRALQTVREWR